MTAYLEDYVSSHIYEGVSLQSRILFGHRVVNAKKEVVSGKPGHPTVWSIHVDVQGTGADAGGSHIFTASKLVAASGLTSVPRMPQLTGREAVSAPVFHHRDFAQASIAIEQGKHGSVQHVAVLGGGKSAADMVYDMIKKDKKVSWIIRKDGEGPPFLFPPGANAPYRNGVEKSATRISAATSSPSSFMEPSWFTDIYHRSAWGVRRMKEYRNHVAEACREHAGYYTRPGARADFKKLDFTTS